jgi:glyoxalase family protein
VKLEGIHHVTCITADAPRNLDFYTRVLGLRLVKKTVNQDDPTVYHLFYADERGNAGADITFFEYPGARPGRAGAGMIHRITWRVGSDDALLFWEERLRAGSVETERVDGRLRFTDPEGLGLELAHVETDDEPLVAEHPEIPAELALQGFDGVRAFSLEPDASLRFLEATLGFTPVAPPAEARSTRTTPRRPSAASAGPAACTTSPGRRPSRITRRGANASRAAAARRRP